MVQGVHKALGGSAGGVGGAGKLEIEYSAAAALCGLLLLDGHLLIAGESLLDSQLLSPFAVSPIALGLTLTLYKVYLEQDCVV